MADVNWAYLDGCSIDESWHFIKCNIHQCAHKYILKYTILNKQRSPIWMTKKVTEAVRAKARAYKTYRKTNSHFHVFKFKLLRNVATAEVKKAKKNFEHKLSSECKLNPKAFCKYVKSKTITKDTIGNLTYNGVTADTDISKANLLNSFFAQVFTRDDMTTLPVIEETQGI